MGPVADVTVPIAGKKQGSSRVLRGCAERQDVLPPESPAAEALSAPRGPCVSHPDVLDTYFVRIHCLQCQGPVPVQRVGRDQRSGATRCRCSGETKPVQQGVEPLVSGIQSHTGYGTAAPEGATVASYSVVTRLKLSVQSYFSSTLKS